MYKTKEIKTNIKYHYKVTQRNPIDMRCDAKKDESKPENRKQNKASKRNTGETLSEENHTG